MKNCIPLLGVFFCLTLLNNCTNRGDEKELEVQTTLKNKKISEKSVQDSTRSTTTTGDPDPPVKDGDDWLTKP